MAKFREPRKHAASRLSQFENAIDKNSSLSKIEKLIYLKNLVGGVAAKAISGFALTESNYDTALELLKTRFGQKNLLIDAHLGSLLNITPIKNTSDTNSLRKLYDRAETEIRNLESLGITSESYEIEAFETEKISAAHIPPPDIDISINNTHLKGLKLADTTNSVTNVLVLIGADNYYDVMTGRIKRISRKLVAAESLCECGV
ncbi:integrase catalytic domain-containing protein [Trichonephila clavipes]|uniref:Integrase catalytic domain-containing protein n=1 Tax=Trichonephila clavipes TaxID=2585209 RepID=A0A8X6WCL9_TRICX|nr:integrase catalytic domain-containing protein [Trichonephila clavipes]